MLEFIWEKTRDHHGVVWTLRLGKNKFARCFWLPGTKKYLCKASVPVPGGAILLDYLGGTSGHARRQLEAELDKRSIAWFGEDTIMFKEAS